jgi:hypothetical protein
MWQGGILKCRLLTWFEFTRGRDYKMESFKAPPDLVLLLARQIQATAATLSTQDPSWSIQALAAGPAPDIRWCSVEGVVPCQCTWRGRTHEVIYLR